MAISTKLQQPYYVEPWEDPNAYVPGDPNAPYTPPNEPAPSPFAPPPTNAPKTPDAPDSGGLKPPDGINTVPTIPDGGGGMVPVPWAPPVLYPEEEYPGNAGPSVPPPAPAPPAPASASPAPAASQPWAPSGGGYTGSYPVAPPPPTSQPWAPSGGGYTGSYPVAPPAQNARPNDYQARGDQGLSDIYNEARILPGNDPRLLKFKGMSDQALEKILNGPDRLGLAKDYYSIFDKETEGDYQRDLKNATNLGAARGRLGSGLLTNSYGDLFERRSSDKDTTKRRLLTDALQGTIGDRQDAYKAMADAENMAYGQGAGDRSEARTEREAKMRQVGEFFNQRDLAFARDASLRGEQRTERSYADDLAYRGRNEQRTDRGYADDLAYRGRSEERTERDYADDLAYRGRNEERTDRSYTDTQTQQALLNRIKQRDQEIAESQRQWDNNYKLWQAGQGPRPDGARPK